MISIALGLLLSAPVDLGSMFNERSHDFGKVAHNSINKHRFVLTNKSDRRIKATSMKSSCVCATPTFVRDVANPGEQIIVEVAYNTKTFYGSRSMNIDVYFSEPRYESVRLQVKGYSRSDIEMSPSLADFGTVSENETPETAFKVRYNRGDDWKIEKIVSSDSVDTTIKELERGRGSVSYEISVKLKEGMQAGPIHESIMLETNDRQTPKLKVPVAGLVESILSAKPDRLELGTVSNGEQLTRRVMMRSKYPFKIVSVGGDTDQVNVESTQDERKLHIVDITITPSGNGPIEKTVKIRTSLENVEPLPIQIIATVK